MHLRTYKISRAQTQKVEIFGVLRKAIFKKQNYTSTYHVLSIGNIHSKALPIEYLYNKNHSCTHTLTCPGCRCFTYVWMALGGRRCCALPAPRSTSACSHASGLQTSTATAHCSSTTSTPDYISRSGQTPIS